MIIKDIKNTKLICLNTAVIGTGAAGYNAALQLRRNGVEDICIITEGVNSGTSRNTGSDKQTYYKLNLCGDGSDSPYEMAEDLFNGKCVDGDIAYAEASLSVKCFLNLAELGVAFPTNRYGEYVGYKTDHDPRTRATSAGPLTSKMMTECLQKAVEDLEVPVLDNLLVISIIKTNGRASGVLCLNENSKTEDDRFVAVCAENIIFATGGPAGIYSNSVYPLGHTGSNGVAFEAGVLGRNLTEWQYGLASVNPRWNVSGTYMQVLPRFVSVDENGNEYEFLSEYYTDIGVCLSKIFRKGYEWPFDSRKAVEGSSVIDLLVYRENILKHRKVYLDFRKNPCGLEDLPYDKTDKETNDYLNNAGACFGTPIKRLIHMNKPAYELYLSKGVDLKKEMLEISLCAQHNNGGLDIDMWWQSNIPHLFVAGEAAGSHGIYRPGGSALNAGQVGSTRAAQYISEHYKENTVSEKDFLEVLEKLVAKNKILCNNILNNENNALDLLKKVTAAMDEAGGAIRNAEKINAKIIANRELLNNFQSKVGAADQKGIFIVYKLREVLISQITYLSAMQNYLELGGKSRGSAIYTAENGITADNLEPLFKFIPDTGEFDDKIQTVLYSDNSCVATTRKRRPLPQGGGFFENVWRRYREDKNIY